MQGRPLPNNLAVGTAIFDLIGRDSSELIRSGIANAVAAGLYCVHLNFSKMGKKVWNILEGRPVELNILTSGEMAIALIEMARDKGEFAQLRCGQHSIGDCDTQHRCKALHV